MTEEEKSVIEQSTEPAVQTAVWQVPVAPEKPFVFTRYEGIAALLSYVLAFLYTYAFTEFFVDIIAADLKGRIIGAVFTLGFIAVTELVYKDTPRPKESRFWLACTVLTALAAVTGVKRVWYTNNADALTTELVDAMFIHCFAVYYALSRSGKLMDRTSGAYVFLDGWHAFIGWPFRYFFRKVRTAFRFVFGAPSDEKEADRKSSLRFLWAIPVLLLGGVLLARTLTFLSSADDSFATLVDKIASSWDPDWGDLGEVIVRLIVSLPIGAYIFGSVDGGKQEEREHIDAQRAEADRVLDNIGRIPSGLWIFVLTLFTVVYVAFFVIQGRYLFSALLGRLPEGFTASGYARQGFFELCKVMVVNFALLWLVNFTSDKKVNASRTLKFSLSLLMAESCLLAVTALSKLILYISRFGFTPKRIESSWLVTVLLTGCVCYLVRLWSGKKTFRFWLIFSCGLLAVTQFLW